jgi:hypothetical protein
VSTEAWRPVVPTGNEDYLSEGWPGYLREAVFRWMQGELSYRNGRIYTTKLVEFQNAARTHLGYESGVTMDWRDVVLPHLRKIPDATFTNLIDFLASRCIFSAGVAPLDYILSQGGSAWTVIPWQEQRGRLTKRVPDGVREAVTTVLSATDAASRKLQESWLDAYGVSPRASVAYSNAVIAVETAVLSVISISKPDATLADVFSILEAKIPKWELIFRDSERAPGATTLVLMLRTLWRGHASRHGRPDYEDASIEEARAAVILAATLVQWFNSGVVVAVES